MRTPESPVACWFTSRVRIGRLLVHRSDRHVRREPLFGGVQASLFAASRLALMVREIGRQAPRNTMFS